jgi:hypothetical protein
MSYFGLLCELLANDNIVLQGTLSLSVLASLQDSNDCNRASSQF